MQREGDSGVHAVLPCFLVQPWRLCESPVCRTVGHAWSKSGQTPTERHRIDAGCPPMSLSPAGAQRMAKHGRLPAPPPMRIRVATAGAVATPVAGVRSSPRRRWHGGAADSVTHHQADFSGEGYGGVASSAGNAAASGQRTRAACPAAPPSPTPRPPRTTAGAPPSPASDINGDGCDARDERSQLIAIHGRFTRPLTCESVTELPDEACAATQDARPTSATTHGPITTAPPRLVIVKQPSERPVHEANAHVDHRAGASPRCRRQRRTRRSRRPRLLSCESRTFTSRPGPSFNDPEDPDAR